MFKKASDEDVKDDKKRIKYAEIILSVIVLFGVALSVTNYTVVKPYYPSVKLLTADRQYNMRTVKSKLPVFKRMNTGDVDFNAPNMFILYKIGCPKCDAAHEETMKLYNSYKHSRNVKYVEYNTSLGQYLVKKYNIEAPYTILITSKYADYKFSEVELDSNNEATSKPNKKAIKEAGNRFAEISMV